MIKVRIFARSLPLVQALEVFSNVTLPYEQQILSRDEKYFLQMDGKMFSDFETNKVSKFKDVYLSEQITDDHRKIIWDYFTAFLKLAQKYRSLTENVTPATPKTS